jgi:CheY-like chemotaxis protein
MRLKLVSAKLLLVEDDEFNRDMLSRRLTRLGFEIVQAMNGFEAIERTEADSPSLVLMDMSLPELDGWEATQRIKANPATRSIPVIALTAHAMASDREKALRAGCDDYDTKPVDMNRLMEKIKKWLP